MHATRHNEKAESIPIDHRMAKNADRRDHRIDVEKGDGQREGIGEVRTGGTTRRLKGTTTTINRSNMHRRGGRPSPETYKPVEPPRPASAGMLLVCDMEKQPLLLSWLQPSKSVSDPATTDRFFWSEKPPNRGQIPFRLTGPPQRPQINGSWNHPLTMENFCLLEVDASMAKKIAQGGQGGAECFELIVKFCYNGGRIKAEFHYISSPCASSSDNSFHAVLDISTESRNLHFKQPLVVCRSWSLNLNMSKKIIDTMICKKLDHHVISSFLFYYKRLKCPSASLSQKCRNSRGDSNQVPLFLMGASCSSEAHLTFFSQIELNWADLLVPSPAGETIAYNINLILRLLDIFLSISREKLLVYQLKKVSELIDLISWKWP
ncbi:hypothetical protein HAX54_015614 [Datura stramonium]|uniref:Uncharacterized protein n=1 Tax=Datura stramonium TaxID=4076 RepID=A0ABS8RGU2_DATST|nr:hypothetical protein [Datura stramonium]